MNFIEFIINNIYIKIIRIYKIHQKQMEVNYKKQKMSNKYPKHLFHVLEPSLGPFFIAFGLFFFVTILAFTMHYVINGYYILLGLSIILITSIYGFLDIYRKAVENLYKKSNDFKYKK